MIHLAIAALVIGIGIGIGKQLVTSARSGRGPRPGWYADPWKQHTLRWWDGAWTGWTHD